MKNIFVLACSLMVLASCADKKNETEKVEETMETPTDSVPKTDSVAVAPVENEQIAEVEKATSSEKEIEVVPAKEVKVAYASFGDKIAADKALTKEQMLQKYKSMKKGDTIAVKFKSKINSVCKKKGCWMKMELPNQAESFVRFKDYGFFVPLNADSQEAVVSGRAFVDEVSVAELKHYAKDGGKSQAEIDKITEPKITYAFQADGVLISK
ncbi:DUF4920 domain-containing protein [Flavobacterium sp. WW92]|uniref:DUF4920 domain-containing protein n=1 Tax=unclassified Flavobacterium TaxID=196869 RepID=UPI002225A0AC|nr:MULTISPECIES: DUF4920 domain-containing protein [unclassified Flavobacterium]WDO12528.1 DUF4920 domain-containing protein [Flavobacterium sp. WW92]